MRGLAMTDNQPAVRPEEHLGLVYREARRVARSRYLHGFNDPDKDAYQNFVGDGYLGLVKACESFDPSRGFKLSTLATPRIRGAILDSIRSESKSRCVHRPEFTELSLTLVDSHPLPVDEAELESIREAVRLVVDAPDLLTRKERLVIVRRYWHEERQVQIARRLRCTESYVSLLMSSAHGKLFGALLPVVLAAPATLLRTIQARAIPKANKRPRRFNQKRCSWCGRAFMPTGPRALYCSAPCRRGEVA
jgi:RNA polymerase sigma factor (sigma-70 family)